MKSFLAKVWKQWKQVGQVIGNFIGRIILMAFYFTVALPFGIVIRFFFDPLRIQPADTASLWLQRESGDCILENAQKQS